MFPELELIARLFAGFDQPWFFAGGWALDLFLSRQTRPHQDVEIAVLRRDQLAVQQYLPDWRFEKAVSAPASLRLPWPCGEWLDLPVHEIHAFSPAGAELEVLLNESDGDDWVFRRNPTVRRPLSQVGVTFAVGFPYLRPEIVLLYKAKNPQGRDEADFENVLPFIDVENILWLREKLSQCHPQHAWLTKLQPPHSDFTDRISDPRRAGRRADS